MKTVLIIGPGANQKALAHRLAATIPIAHIARVRSHSTFRPSFFTRVASATVGAPMRNAWGALMREYDRAYDAFPAGTQCYAEPAGVNGSMVREMVERERPQLVLVSGTNLLRDDLIRRIHAYGRVMNLHTGISPHIKGGPNCTNWALALREFDLIGNTVMWLDEGIDSGNIIATEKTALTGRENLLELHRKVMDHAHDLYCRCAAAVVAGETVPSVAQGEIGTGRLFLTKHWTARKIAAAAWNHRRHFRPDAVNRIDPALVPLRVR